MAPGPAAAARRLLVPALVLALAACGGDAGRDTARAAESGDGSGGEASGRPAAADATCAALTSVSPDSMRTTDSGLQILQVGEGSGAEAAVGDEVAVHYLGCLTDGTEFDASYDRNQPIRFRLGTGEVIAGWDEGVAGMRPGGVRILRIPPELGYGSRGTPGGPIPPDATLLFRVELVEVAGGAGANGG